MAQTSYSNTQPIAFAGQLADVGIKRVETGVNKHTLPLSFGTPVTKGTNGGEFKPVTGTSDKVFGFVLHSHDVDQRDLTGTQGVPVDAPMNVMTAGVMYVLTECAVSAHDPVYVRWQYGPHGDTDGAIRNTADANVAWASTHAYVVGDRVTSDSAKLYECITAGTSHRSSGPTGTTADITDDGSAHATNTVTCAAVQVGDTVTVGGVVFTAIANGGSPTGTQFALGTGGSANADTAAALAAAITSATEDCGATAEAVLAVVTITSNGHAAGNNVTLVTSNGTRLAVGTAGGKLSGGLDAAHWKYVATVSGATAASANIVKGATFRTAAAAGALAEVEFSKLVSLS